MMLGVVLVTLCIALIALVSGWRVRSTGEFTVAGRRDGWAVVSGIIVGALVGGSSTIGTAQAAFVYGMPAWWFTLGAGVGWCWQPCSPRPCGAAMWKPCHNS